MGGRGDGWAVKLSLTHALHFCLTFTPRYDPGDVLMVAPKNMPDTVDEFLKLLNLNPETSFSLTQNDPGRDTWLP